MILQNKQDKYFKLIYSLIGYQSFGVDGIILTELPLW